ncbi:alpha/beta-hydrolase family protein [Nocardia sp. NPDC049707]|uniref:alpha/beta-hydrolase family protein n=1 Tax=Nocardia sp. NPDC049707 TaxID=3154735 RepID=UPI00341503C6
MSTLTTTRPVSARDNAGTSSSPSFSPGRGNQWKTLVTKGFHRAAHPRIGTTLGIGLGTLISLAPGLLPRTPSAQAMLTGLLAAAALAGAGILRFALLRWDFDINRRLDRFRTPLLGSTALVVVGMVAQATHWQNRLRTAMDTALIGPDYWLRWALISIVIVAVLTGVVRVTGWFARKLGPVRSIAVGVVAASALYLVGIPAAVNWRQSTYAAANATIDPELVQPVSYIRSGSAGSAISWPSLGAQGRKFVTGSPSGPIRVYVGLDSATDIDSRVALAIRELERSGGFERSNIVLAVPTGSGWIDPDAARGFYERFGSDVALVGMQYSYAPSWVTFVFGRDTAVAYARALFNAVERRIGTLDHKPELYVYGQSLGALGGSSIFADDADQDRRTCAALWAGPPAGQVHHAGATVLANSSDPVVHWSPSLLWRAPELRDVRVDAPVPQWLPVVSFLQTSADLLAALNAPAGHGHRYGTDQGTAMGTC